MTLRIINSLQEGARSKALSGKDVYERLTASVRRISSEIYFKSIQNSAHRFITVAESSEIPNADLIKDAISELNRAFAAAQELQDDLNELLEIYSNGDMEYAKMFFRAIKISSFPRVAKFSSLNLAAISVGSLGLADFDSNPNNFKDALIEAVKILDYAKNRLRQNIDTNHMAITRVIISKENKSAVSPDASPTMLKKLAQQS